MSIALDTLEATLLEGSNPKRAAHHTRFFKTGKGEYGEGDQFIGLTLPFLRKIMAKYYKDLSLQDLETLIYSPIHEKRLFAIMVLVKQYNAKKLNRKESIFQFYSKHIDQVNNWDLVDASAPHIIGHYLFHRREYNLLHDLSRAPQLWRRRISIIATLYAIRQNQWDITLLIAQQLLHDSEDLIHKAVGWMLREVGKRDLKPLFRFLDQHSHYIPRTMLRYALERVPDKERTYYMAQRKHRHQNR